MLHKSMILFVLGFFMTLAGAIVLLIANLLYGSGDAQNSVILIFTWPFPIVLAAGPDTVWLTLFAAVLAVLGAIAFWRLVRKVEEI